MNKRLNYVEIMWGIDMEKDKNKIYLVREIVESNGKQYSNFFVNATFVVCGKSVNKKIRMDVPRNDIGMYDVLDMVFTDHGSDEVELYRIAKVNRDMVTQKKTTTYRYEVANVDDTLRAVIVPNGLSNTALLDKLYKDLNAETQVEDEEA